ncbi:SCO4225 family membrane protein [Streptomyces sp. DSM 40750]|uniref:SCO4225 family membrane protein n=1 Tax=Streptomyces sp. DSM 40750 TaxID=2801030 RepID=UPI00214C3B57|nr:hypothetical protein [Streptomyces sp. DSM 40750]UUU23694.1 hypothetical protein JIX55_27440 [Streptomyces sp. DSM 40750]
MTGTDTDSGRSLPRRSLPRRSRPAVGDIVALVYLAACVALLIWAIVVSSGEGSDGSMAAVIPLLATAPVSFVWLVLPDGAVTLVVAVVLGGVANAALISWCGRALRRGDRPDPTP